jgi:hypothetical protein
LRSQILPTAAAVLAACFIATGLSTLTATTRAAALTHNPNLNATEVPTSDSTKAKKEDKRGANAAEICTMRHSDLRGHNRQQALPRVVVQSPGKDNDGAAQLIRVAGSISWERPASCLNGTRKSVLRHAAGRFAHIHITSTCRSYRHNRRVGGARHSHHIGGNAVDFRVRGNYGAAKSFLRTLQASAATSITAVAASTSTRARAAAGKRAVSTKSNLASADHPRVIGACVFSSRQIAGAEAPSLPIGILGRTTTGPAWPSRRLANI